MKIREKSRASHCTSFGILSSPLWSLREFSEINFIIEKGKRINDLNIYKQTNSIPSIDSVQFDHYRGTIVLNQSEKLLANLGSSWRKRQSYSEKSLRRKFLIHIIMVQKFLRSFHNASPMRATNSSSDGLTFLYWPLQGRTFGIIDFLY